jgi:phosphoserine phosphatase
MDGTLLSGRLVFALSEKLGNEHKVKEIQEDGALPGHEKTKRIAALFAGVSKKDVESAIGSIPLAKNCEQAISMLQAQGFRTGIISDSYTVAASVVARRLNMDFVAANDLEFNENGIATGRVMMPMGWEKIGCKCHLSVCKRFHLEKYAAEFGVEVANTVAIGDTRSDICMVRRAGTGIAFMPKDADIARATQNVVRTPDMMQVVTCTLRRT